MNGFSSSVAEEQNLNGHGHVRWPGLKGMQTLIFDESRDYSRISSFMQEYPFRLFIPFDVVPLGARKTKGVLLFLQEESIKRSLHL